MAVLRLKEIMKEKQVSREALAETVGVSKTTITNINTELHLPSIDLLIKIAKALEVDIRELFVPTKSDIITLSNILEAKNLIQKGLSILEGK